jgi:hypothetical protein
MGLVEKDVLSNFLKEKFEINSAATVVVITNKNLSLMIILLNITHSLQIPYPKTKKSYQKDFILVLKPQ